MARLQLDSHDCPAGRIPHDGCQRDALGGDPATPLTTTRTGTLPALAADLAARTDAALVDLLLARPDAMNPPAASFADLASRLSSRASLDVALDGLTLDQLRSLEALRLGEGAPSAVAALQALALVMAQPPLPAGHDAGPHHYILPAAVAQALAASPAPTLAGLGQPVSAAGLSAAPAMKASPAMVENAAASAGAALLHTMALLGDHAGSEGLPALAHGAVSAVTHRRLARALNLDERHIHFHLELAAAAGLLVFDARSRRWWPADQAPLDRAALWLLLVQSWLRSARPPSLLESPAAPGKPLAPAEPPAQAGSWRRQALRARADFPDLNGAQLLGELFARRPRQAAALSAQLPALLREMELLGLTGAGVPGALARAAAVESWDGAQQELRRLLPPPVATFMLQGDLTAVAPGFLAPDVAATLKLLSRQEGQGAASVHRFSRGSLEAATAAGLNGPDILAFLHRHSSTAVPQALEFMVQEAARTAAEGTAAGNPAPAGSTPAPTPAIRKRGSRTPPAWLAAAPRPRSGVVRRQAQEQLELLRSNPTWGAGGAGESGPALVVEVLRQALARATPVRLHIVNNVGEASQVPIQPLSLHAGTLRALDLGTGLERRFSIHRIAAVADAAAPSGTTSERQPHG